MICECDECAAQAEHNWRFAIAHLHVLLKLVDPQDRAGEIERFCEYLERGDLWWGVMPRSFIL